MIKIYIKLSTKENIVLTIQSQITLSILHKQISQTLDEMEYMHKRRLLNWNQSLNKQGIEDGDLIIQMLKQEKNNKQKDYQQNEDIILDNAEDYKEKVLELIEFGFRREEVVQAMQQNNNNYTQAIQALIFGKKRLNTDEQDNETNLDEIKDKIMSIPELNTIIDCIKSDDWEEKFYQIQQNDSKIFNKLLQNTIAFFELLAELQSI